MAHAIWKGHLAFGLVQIPVALVTAESRDEIDFDLLDRRDGHAIGYAKVNKVTGREVPAKEIVKGFAVTPGRYVHVTDADFKRAAVESTRTVDVSEFVPPSAIDPIYFDNPYYVVPTKGGERPCALLIAALRELDRIGIGRIVLRARAREHVVAIRPYGSILLLQTLRYAHEIRSLKEIDSPKAIKAAPRELAMAKRLIAEMEGKWSPAAYKDRYRDALLAVIRKKAKAGGRELEEPVEEEKEPAAGRMLDLAALLKRSIDVRHGRASALTNGHSNGHANGRANGVTRGRASSVPKRHAARRRA